MDWVFVLSSLLKGTARSAGCLECICFALHVLRINMEMCLCPGVCWHVTSVPWIMHSLYFSSDLCSSWSSKSPAGNAHKNKWICITYLYLWAPFTQHLHGDIASHFSQRFPLDLSGLLCAPTSGGFLVTSTEGRKQELPQLSCPWKCILLGMQGCVLAPCLSLASSVPLLLYWLPCPSFRWVMGYTSPWLNLPKEMSLYLVLWLSL